MHSPSKSTRPWLATILILAIIFFAILVTLGIIMLRGWGRDAQVNEATATTLANNSQPSKVSPSKTPQTEPSETAQSETRPTQETTPTEESTDSDPDPVATLDPQTEALMDTIEKQVSRVRRLSLENPVPRKVLTEDELRAYVNEEMLEDFEEAESKEDLRRFALLGLFPRDMDMRQLLEDLYSEQIAGFYKTEDKEMYVVAGEKLSVNQRLTYAHEFVHALQYANYDIKGELDYDEDKCEDDSERCAAILALIEGDATFSQYAWFERFATQRDFIELLAEYEEYESPVFDAAPPYMTASMMFPYDKGLGFVQYLYNQDGYNSIDRAFTTTPPLTTEQIMFPERYPDDLPVKVTLPDFERALGQDWDLDDDGVIGSWDIYMMLTQGIDESFRIDEALALQAAEGWGGDAYAFLSNKSQDEYLYAMKTVWDSDEDSEEAWNAFNTMMRQRFGNASSEGVFAKDDYYARIFKTGNNGFVLIIAESRESLDLVFEIISD